MEKCKTTKPDPIERSALAAMLHAFYTGVENILKRIALGINGRLPEGEFWHLDMFIPKDVFLRKLRD